MRNKALALLLMITSVIYCQDYFYSSKGKIQLNNLSRKNFIVKFKDDVTHNTKRTIIHNTNKIIKKQHGNIISSIDDHDTLKGKRYILSIYNDINESELRSYLNLLRNNNEVEYAHEIFLDNKGCIFSYTNEAIVKLKNTTSITVFLDLVSKTGSEVVKNNKYNTQEYTICAGNKFNRNGLLLANYLFETNLFEYSQPNAIINGKPLTSNLSVSSDLTSQQWGLEKTKVIDVWNKYTKGNPGIKIAVFDMGVQNDHPDLVSNRYMIGGGYDCYGDPGNYGDMDNSIPDCNSHGTECIGVSIASDNGFGITGVAPLCHYIPIRVMKLISSLGEDNCVVNPVAEPLEASSIQEAMNWAIYTAEANIFSISVEFSNWFDELDYLNATIYDASVNHNIPIFVASGNDGEKTDHPLTELSKETYNITIAVGSSNKQDKRSNFSSYGSELDIVAPGEDMNLTTALSNYKVANGTSYATPFAAGVMALMLSVNPNLKFKDAFRILFSTCDKINDGVEGISYSYNVFNHELDISWNEQYGYGRINALKAVERALYVKNNPTPELDENVITTMIYNSSARENKQYNHAEYMAISDNDLLLGTVYKNVNENSQYVNEPSNFKFYHYDNTKWNLVLTKYAQITCFDIDNNYAVIGNKFANDLKGRIYFYKKTQDGNWTELSNNPDYDFADPFSKDYFGTSVALSGDNLIVGGCSFQINGDYYVRYFRRTEGDKWNYISDIVCPDALVGYWGKCLKIDGTSCIISNGSKAYIYDLKGDNWEFKNKISNIYENDNNFHFPMSAENRHAFDISGDYAAFLTSDNCDNYGEIVIEGTIVIYHKEEGAWIEKQKILPKCTSFNPMPSYYTFHPITGVEDGNQYGPLLFGRSIQILGDQVIVGYNKTYNWDYWSPARDGRVFQFRKLNDGNWYQINELYINNPTTLDDNTFGDNTLLSKSCILVNNTGLGEAFSEWVGCPFFNPFCDPVEDAYYWTNGKVHNYSNLVQDGSITLNLGNYKPSSGNYTKKGGSIRLAGNNNYVTLVNGVNYSFQASEISLKPGFSAKLGCNFEAKSVYWDPSLYKSSIEFSNTINNNSNAPIMAVNKTIYSNYFNDSVTVNSDIENIIFYPNPNNGYFKIICKEKPSKVSIYSLSGILVYEKIFNSDDISVDISYCNSGLYEVIITTDLDVRRIMIEKLTD